LTQNIQPIYFELIENIPVFNVTVNGESKRFILDSGSPHMVLNGKYEDGGGMAAMEAKPISSFEWGWLRLTKQLAMVSELSHLEQRLNTTIHGLIGCAQFVNYDLLLDYRERHVVLIDSYGETPGCMGNAKAIPFTMSNHIPVIPVKIGNTVFSLGLDTGASQNAIGKEHKRYLEEMGLLSDITQDDVVRFNTENTEQGACFCSIKDVVIGNSFSIDGMRFAFHDLRIPGFRADGILGYELFSRQKTLIRFMKRELIVQEGFSCSR
jgi:hypothetical protein